MGYNSTNTDREFYSGCEYGMHAEMAALTKYSRHSKIYKSKKTSTDLVVVKINRSGVMSCSKPCFMCIKMMMKSNYNINYIYYSNDENTVVRTTVKELYESPKHISSRFRKRLNNNKKR